VVSLGDEVGEPPDLPDIASSPLEARAWSRAAMRTRIYTAN
jgi:hypothetical protein